MTPTEGQLRVWWIRNVPGPATFKAVETPKEGAEQLRTWAAEDLRNPSVETNAGGMEVFEDGEWTDWYDAEGQNVDEAFDL